MAPLFTRPHLISLLIGGRLRAPFHGLSYKALVIHLSFLYAYGTMPMDAYGTRWGALQKLSLRILCLLPLCGADPLPLLDHARSYLSHL